MARPERPTTGALVWHLGLRWRAAVDRAVAPLGLTHALYSALASLWALTRGGERPSQRRLAEYTGLGPIYVSKLVRALERNGLVARTPDPADARAVQVTLTDQGVETADRAIGIVRALDAQLTAVLGGPGSAEIQALGRSLQTLLDAAPGPDGSPETGRGTMSTSPTPIRPLTFDIGEAERTLRALLDRRLDKVGLTFAEWTALVFLDGGEPLTGREVVQRQLAGRVAPEATVRAAVERLQAVGLVGRAEGSAQADGDEARLAITADGEAVFRPLRQTVSVATSELFGDLPAEDLEATRRTLNAITRRVTAKLAEPAA